jgi:hypothetical protein
MKLLVMQFPPISRHFISLRSKYSPQHPSPSVPPNVRLRTASSKLYMHYLCRALPIYMCSQS